MGWGGLEFASKVRSSSIVLRGSLVNVWFHPRNGSVLALDEGGVMFAGAADAWAMDVVLSAVVEVGGSVGVAVVVRGAVAGAIVGACVPRGCAVGVVVGCESDVGAAPWVRCCSVSLLNLCLCEVRALLNAML